MGALLVSLVLDLVDLTESPLVRGSVTVAPSLQIPDPSDLQLIAMAPRSYALRAGASFPVAQGVSTDSAGPQPDGWTWNLAYSPGTPGTPAPASYYVPAGPADVTMSHASPAVFTWTATTSLTALYNGVGLTLAGSFPGFEGGTTYYVTGLDGTTFSLAASQGGSAIASTGTGSGTLTVVQYNLSMLATVPAGQPGQQYLPLPSGTPASGQVPVATGDGEASAWGSPGAGTVTSVNDVDPVDGNVTLDAADVGALAVDDDGDASVTGNLTAQKGLSVSGVSTTALNEEGVIDYTGPDLHFSLPSDESFWWYNQGRDTNLLMKLDGSTGELSATAPTQSAGDDSTKLATTAYADSAASAAQAAAEAASVPASDLPLSITDGGYGGGNVSANEVFAGPSSGSAAAPSMRALVAADIPLLTPYVSEPLTSGAQAIWYRALINSTAQLDSGTLQLVYFTSCLSGTCQHILTVAGGTAMADATYAAIGIYEADSAGNCTSLLASTGDLHTSLWNEMYNEYNSETTASFAVTAGQRYAVAALAVAGTPPSLICAQLAGLYTDYEPVMCAVLASQSALPATVAAGDIASGPPYGLLIQAVIAP